MVEQASGTTAEPAVRLRIGPLTRTDFVRFAGAAGDFNPIHHDDGFARDNGYRSAFAMGLFTASVASRAATDHFGLAGVASYEVKFLAPVWPDETLDIVGQALMHGEFETLEITVSSLEGELKMTGTATGRRR